MLFSDWCSLKTINESKNKVAIIMRGLPGSGKSTMVKKILDRMGGSSEDNVFSTDDRYNPIAKKLVSNKTFSEGQKVDILKGLINQWHEFEDDLYKKKHSKQFQQFMRFIGQNDIDSAFDYAKTMHDIFSYVEYRNGWKDPNPSKKHQENFEMFQKAVESGVSPVIVDNTNVSLPEAEKYVNYAKQHGYEVVFKEPDSNHWLSHKHLLYDKEGNKDKLDAFAKLLSDKSAHGVPQNTLRNMINKWHVDMSLNDFN